MSSPPPSQGAAAADRVAPGGGSSGQSARSRFAADCREGWKEETLAYQWISTVGEEPHPVGFIWKIPTVMWLQGVLKNPFYAGAYVYGRRARETVLSQGRVIKRVGRVRRAEESRIFLRDHHEGYISWETFQENLAMIQRNVLAEGDTAVAAVRSGHGLLAGLLRSCQSPL